MPMASSSSRLSSSKTKKRISKTVSLTLPKLLHQKENATMPKKSVSIADVLKAGKLVIPKVETVWQLVLEYFDIRQQMWTRKELITFHIQNKRFADWAFRNASVILYQVNCNSQKFWKTVVGKVFRIIQYVLGGTHKNLDAHGCTL